jgi:valyl-tRNA synthetase
MLHPIIPFFTEHVWDQAANILEKGSQRISQSQWPHKLDFESLKSEKVNLFINLISSIRSTRAELNVPAKSKVKISYSNVSSDLEEIIEKNKEIIVSLTRSDSFKKEEYSKDEGMVQVIFNDGLIYLSLKGIIDFEEEKRRLQKNLKKTELELNKIHSKLNDKNFINNAPEEIILEQKEREKEYQLSKDKITKTIQNFE